MQHPCYAQSAILGQGMDSPDSASHEEALLHGASLLHTLLQIASSSLTIVKLGPQLLQLSQAVCLPAGLTALLGTDMKTSNTLLYASGTVAGHSA